jgi:transcriptional regulator with XRE-family HTH domain
MKLTLSAARVNNGYTMKEASALIGVHWQTLSAWERDSSRLTISEVEKLSKLYHVDKDELFFGPKNEFIRKIRQAG